MRHSKLVTAVTTIAAAATLVLGLAPQVQAATAYEMFGYGELVATSGPGMPFCPVDCTEPTTVYTFQTLPITGVGILLDEQVNATYDCPSDVTAAGNTSNFKITWDFTCNRTNGVGPATITGSFNNLANPGVPVFEGVFNTSAGSVPSTCSGGFMPTEMDGVYIARALFAGECTSVAA